MAKNTMNSKEIIDLLGKAKAGTPDYPADLMAARKAAFLKQSIVVKIDTKGQGGQQGGSSGSGGGSGAALGGGSAVPGVLLQALIGLSIVAAMFLAAYAYRDQITEVLRGSEVAAMEDSSQPLLLSSGTTVTVAPNPVAPGLVGPSPVGVPTSTPVAGTQDGTEINGAVVAEGTLSVESNIAEGTKTNNGLHLGQTPGTPAAPGQDNPGNPNQPDKPEKPTKDTSTKPEKKPTKAK